MTREKAIMHFERYVNDDCYTVEHREACKMAVAALLEQEERDNVWHDAKDNPPQKPGVYYGKVDDTDSMFACQYRDGVWTMNAYPGTRMPITEWAYYDEFVREDEERRWIPVKERLPAKSGDYIVMFDGICMTVHYSARHKAFNSYDSFDAGESEELSMDCTHWMPLPEPPKEDA